MTWLLTTIVSELRKGERAHSGLRAWFADADEARLLASVFVIGALRRGVELLHRLHTPSALELALPRPRTSLYRADAGR